jgi:hypothetical protein
MAATKKPKAAPAKRIAPRPVAKKKPAIKKPAVKKTGRVVAKKPAVRKSVAKKVSRPAAGKQMTSSKKMLGNIGKMLEGIKLSGAAGILLDGRRKDVEALLKVSRKSYKEVQNLVERRSRELKNAIGDWKDAAKKIHISDPKDSVVKLEAIGNEAFKLAVKNLHDLSEVATKSQGETLDVIKKRIRENVADVKKLLHKK